MKRARMGITGVALAALLGLVPAHALGQQFLASGQTRPFGPGSDGDVRAGAVLSYTDNGDGTITDNNTGLMWEKKDESGGIHDRHNRYRWGTNGVPFPMNGSMVTEFLATLNRAPCFAGHCDWRIPNVRELQSLVDFGVPYPGPTVNKAFHDPVGCPHCTDITLPSCSCTSADRYWTSSTYVGRKNGSWAWYVHFSGGTLRYHDKFAIMKIRAVRGGL
jgi:hypothetical protein